MAIFTGSGSAAAPSITFSADTNTGVFSPGADQLAVSTGGTGRLFIDSSGRLLVGTSSYIDLWNNSQNLILAGQGNKGIGIASAGANSVISMGRSSGTDPAAFGLVASEDTLGVLTFNGGDGSSRVPAARIVAEVDGTPGANDMPGRLVFSTTADGAGFVTERMRITQSGNTLFGCTTDPSASVAGAGFIRQSNGRSVLITSSSSTASNFLMAFYNPNGLVGDIRTDGSATAYNTSSDYRLKENVVPLTGAIDRIQQIPVHRFNFIADPDKTVDGFIAHEAQAVVPECVTGTKDEVDSDDNPVYQGIDQSKLVPLLTAALQEAIGRIETLEAEVASLKAS